MKHLALTLIMVAFAAIICGCSDQNPADASRVHSFTGPTMGTSYSIKLVADDSIDLQKLQAEVQQVLDRVNGRMSTYQADSELSLFNKSATDTWFSVSAETAHVVALANEISVISGGAFDATVGPLVNLWGFGPDPSKAVAPSDESINKAMQIVGYKNIEVQTEPSALRKSANAYLDLSAIAKGYAVDEVAKVVGAKTDSYLVEVGGELKAKGVKPNGDAWMIAIESPVVGAREIQKIIKANDIAIATSGDYRNYFEENGVRYSHTIDPDKGKPISHRLASVTVLDNSCARADAMATALMVLGEEKGLQLAKQLKMPVFMIYKTPSGFAEVYTESFEPYLHIEN